MNSQPSRRTIAEIAGAGAALLLILGLSVGNAAQSQALTAEHAKVTAAQFRLADCADAYQQQATVTDDLRSATRDGFGAVSDYVTTFDLDELDSQTEAISNRIAVLNVREAAIDSSACR